MNVFNIIVHDHAGRFLEKRENMTFAVKANIGCGLQGSASTPGLRGWTPKNISPVVQSLLNGGHQMVAVTNMHELAFGITSENPAFGDVDNPRKAGYIPGGSSGGSAAAVAMNAVSFSLGTDTGGSMRIPASLCGVVGYRPTIGLYDASTVCPLSSTTDTIGIFAQRVSTVQDAHATIIPSFKPAVQPLQGVRIGVPRKHYYNILDAQVASVTEAALKSLQAAGAVLVEIDPLIEFSDATIKTFFDLLKYETNDLVPKYLVEQDAPVNFEELSRQIGDPVVKKIFGAASEISKEVYRESQQFTEEVIQAFADYFKTNALKAFVCPTTILPAVERPTSQNVTVDGKKMDTLEAYIHNSYPQALAGVPCISLPSGVTSEGLPVGLEVVAPRGEDSYMLHLAAAIQEELPSMPTLNFDDFRARL